MTAARGSHAAVIDGVLRHVSASQVKEFQRCNRRWWFSKVAGIRSESTGAQNTGTAIHSQMEAYYLTGTPPTHPSALRAVQSGELPGRRADILVEAEIEEPTLEVDGVRYKGFIDLVVPPPGDAAVLQIIDWKSTSSWKYCKTPEELAKDIQMGSYGFWAHKRYPEAQVLRLAHVYLLTDKRRVAGAYRIVEVEAQWKDVYRVWGDIVTAIYQMKDTAMLPNAEHVEPNWDACEDFGGCPQFSTCHTQASLYDLYEPEAAGSAAAGPVGPLTSVDE